MLRNDRDAAKVMKKEIKTLKKPMLLHGSCGTEGINDTEKNILRRNDSKKYQKSRDITKTVLKGTFITSCAYKTFEMSQADDLIMLLKNLLKRKWAGSLKSQ